MAEAELAEAAEAALATTQLRWRPGWRRWSWCDEALARRKPRPFTIILERCNGKPKILGRTNFPNFIAFSIYHFLNSGGGGWYAHKK